MLFILPRDSWHQLVIKNIMMLKSLWINWLWNRCRLPWDPRLIVRSTYGTHVNGSTWVTRWGPLVGPMLVSVLYGPQMVGPTCGSNGSHVIGSHGGAHLWDPCYQGTWWGRRTCGVKCYLFLTIGPSDDPYILADVDTSSRCKGLQEV